MSDAPLDLLGTIAGPYQPPMAAPPAPALLLPRAAPAAPPPVPTAILAAPAQQIPQPAPAPQPAVPEPAPGWWSVTHPSDPRPRTYCGTCYRRIPDFLVASFQRLDEPDAPPAGVHCDGCGTSPDLTAETLEVLAAFIDMVQATDSYPTKDSLGDAATLACLEHARQCVALCAAARGTLDA